MMYLVDTVSMFRIRYVVDTDNPDYAADAVAMMEDGFKEFSQKHLGETITSVRPIDTEEYLRVFNEDNDYITTWTDSQKLSFINT